MDNILHTKFGNCSLNSNGRYRVTSRQEGNHGKLLHRLIWEDFYKCEVPDGFVIHHKNRDYLDNCILNLQLIRDESHKKLHGKQKDNSLENNPMWNKSHNKSSMLKMSNAKSKTGIYRVYKLKDSRSKLGFRWCYEFRHNGERHTFSSNDLKKLKLKVISKGYDWKIVDESKVRELCKLINIEYEEMR